MTRASTKTAAEAVLRELPSVLGAYVSEDLEGHPREVHLLVSPGPDAAHLARDIRGLLEERLGIPIDQRVISIAQLAHEPADAGETQETSAEPLAGPVAAERVGPGPGFPDARPVFAGIEATGGGGRVTVTVRLQWQGEEARGTGDATDTISGRARAATTATLDAAMRVACDGPGGGGGLMLELEFASIVQALDGDYVLVSVLALSERIGRRPLPLVGAHPVESDVEGAAALASLKAVNRILSLALQQA